MALQPAAGARDLNPQQVEKNHSLSKKLAEVYKKWGYDEVSPPRVERLATLMAGGAIESKEIVHLVADEPLGLRPEMTASIARAACTRLSERPRPLRLWATGTVFESKQADEGGIRIEEKLKSGVELFGVKEVSAEMELLSLLLKSLEALEINQENKPQILIGHTEIMDLILKPLSNKERIQVKRLLIEYDHLSLERLNIKQDILDTILNFIQLRGLPNQIIQTLKQEFGKSTVLNNLERVFNHIEPLAQANGISLQLDPSFQPHFNLYNGLVFQLVCEGKSSPIVLASGGRYDQLVERCGGDISNSYGVGFSFSIDDIRELLPERNVSNQYPQKLLIAFDQNNSLEKALLRQTSCHLKGEKAIVELEPCKNENEATQLIALRGCTDLIWIGN